MHASTLFLAALLPFALASAGACAANDAAAPPSQVAADAGTVPAENAPAPRPSTRAALERVLEVVVKPGSTVWELSRIEARGDGATVRLWMDVEVRGSDELQVNVNLELLLEGLRGLEGARDVDVRSSNAMAPTWLRLSGVSVAFDSQVPRTDVDAASGPELMTTIRSLATEPAVRMGGVDIERRGSEDDALRVSAHSPGEGERLDRLQRFLGELEARVPDARVVRILLAPAWNTGAEAAPAPLRYHWQFEVERGA